MSTLLRKMYSASISRDLARKMVFLGGPRQVGKTTLAQSLVKNFRDDHPAYLNWDDAGDRERILKRQWPPDQRLIIFDELHKYKNWRNLIKGYYDKLKNSHEFLVTGSARLDFYRRGGDSLLGRYYYHRLHPLSLTELGDFSGLDHLLKFGGFPEPYLNATEVELKRWHRQRRERIVYSDIRDLEFVREISLMELLIHALPERVGSPLSRKNLAGDIGVDQKTVERWIGILEQVYYCFRISPYGSPKIRAVKKEQKLFLWDWSEHTSKGKRWENFIASQLLKFCHYHEDNFGDQMDLRFLRDTDKREVDFVVIRNNQPLFAVECKSGEGSVPPHLKYFSERTNIPVFYQIHSGEKSYQISDRIKILSFGDFSRLVELV